LDFQAFDAVSAVADVYCFVHRDRQLSFCDEDACGLFFRWCHFRPCLVLALVAVVVVQTDALEAMSEVALVVMTC
jgi:hypothetical protein